MSENKIKAFEEKVEKLESNIDSNRGQINTNLEAICWIRKLVLKLNKQKVFFWQLKKEISELKEPIEANAIINNELIEYYTRNYKKIETQEKVLLELTSIQEDFLDYIKEDYDDGIKIYERFIGRINDIKKKFNSKLKVTISRDDGEKGENSKDVISSKENNLSTPERRKDGETPSELPRHCGTCIEFKGFVDSGKTTLCPYNDECKPPELPKWKPKEKEPTPYEPLLKKDAVIEFEDKCKDCLAHQFDEEFGHMCISPLY